jgi:hypothetical protein
MRLPNADSMSPVQELSDTLGGVFGRKLYSTFVKVSTDPNLAKLLGVSSPMKNIMPASID